MKEAAAQAGDRARTPGSGNATTLRTRGAIAKMMAGSPNLAPRIPPSPPAAGPLLPSPPRCLGVDA